jgi:pimeloyl-ACP methyl ester carboxylesterase
LPGGSRGLGDVYKRQSQMLVLNNVGHIPMEEAPNQVATAILGFIK